GVVLRVVDNGVGGRGELGEDRLRTGGCRLRTLRAVRRVRRAAVVPGETGVVDKWVRGVGVSGGDRVEHGRLIGAAVADGRRRGRGRELRLRRRRADGRAGVARRATSERQRQRRQDVAGRVVTARGLHDIDERRDRQVVGVDRVGDREVALRLLADGRRALTAL